ncbi:DUF6049 family protein [Nocardioides sp. Root151]|uniref:DUF6049 family protein n=1 Tax=Nocardioides sp. Root151 TaxID=1736475 RepID=UPI0007035E22|nr:DUF6049 family protein [Nocardioides sp. Root151]KQZ68932.1 hypothetical protein ASD66_16960 [Nocardioides sp. Root151]
MIRPLAALRTPVVPVLAVAFASAALVIPTATATGAVAAPVSGAVSGTVAAPARVGTTSAAEADPLSVTIDSMTPSVIPRKGPIRLTGSVTNTSDDPWLDVKIYPRLSFSPFTTSAEVDLAAESDPRLPFGDRITTEGHFDESIASLDPGETRAWSIRVPREVWAAKISGAEGIYQIGVQALAANTDGERPDNAIGRARTFIPLVDVRRPEVPTSIVVPIRGPVERHADGRLADVDEWATALGPNGRLAQLASMVDGSDTLPVTWAIDPAIVTAVEQLADGNPPRDLGVPDEEADATEDEETVDEEVPTGAAQAWLDDVTALADAHEVLALPYGDLDVAAASANDGLLYGLSRKLSSDVFKRLKVSATPAVAPPSGLLPGAAIDGIDPGTTMLMSDEAVPGAADDEEESDQPSRLQLGDHQMSLYDATMLNVPAGDVQNALTVRQRTLAEAAVRSLADDTDPLLVNLPTDFDPGTSASDFFAGLDRPFVDVRRLSTNTGGRTREVKQVDYPRRQEQRELGSASFTSARELMEAGATLDDILADTDGIERQTAEEALTYTSYMVRDDQFAAEQLADGATSWLESRLRQVTIEAPSFVILSAANGPFAVKITNGLEVPVTLSIKAHTQDNLEIRAPGTIEIGAKTSRTIQLDATASSIGVHPVDLVATDSQGRPLGSSEEMSVRSNSVGKVIWVILGVGVGILFLAIPVRLIRRYRKSRAA